MESRSHLALAIISLERSKPLLKPSLFILVTLPNNLPVPAPISSNVILFFNPEIKTASSIALLSVSLAQKSYARQTWKSWLVSG